MIVRPSPEGSSHDITAAPFGAAGCGANGGGTAAGLAAGGNMIGVCSSERLSAAADALALVRLPSAFIGSAWPAMLGSAAAWLSAELANGSAPARAGARPNRLSIESAEPEPPPDPGQSGISGPAPRPPTSRPKLPAPPPPPSERAKSSGRGGLTGSGAKGSQSSGMPPAAAAADAGGGIAADRPGAGGCAGWPKPAKGSPRPAEAGCDPAGAAPNNPPKSANGSSALPPGTGVAVAATTRIA